MDQAAVDRLVAWATERYADREWVQKDELIADARDADVPDSAKRALRELPQERWPRDVMLDKLRHIREPQVRTRMDGPKDGVPGGGHEGELEL